MCLCETLYDSITRFLLFSGGGWWVGDGYFFKKIKKKITTKFSHTYIREKQQTVYFLGSRLQHHQLKRSFGFQKIKKLIFF